MSAVFDQSPLNRIRNELMADMPSLISTFQQFISIGTAFVKTFDESGRHAIINFNNLYLQLSIFRHSSWIPADMLVIFQLLVSIEPAIFTVLPTYSWTFNFWKLKVESSIVCGQHRENCWLDWDWSFQRYSIFYRICIAHFLCARCLQEAPKSAPGGTKMAPQKKMEP